MSIALSHVDYSKCCKYSTWIGFNGGRFFISLTSTLKNCSDTSVEWHVARMYKRMENVQSLNNCTLFRSERRVEPGEVW